MREFTVLCGATGKGKTTWLANLSEQLIRDRVKHFVMSIETGETDYIRRVLSILEKRDLNTGEAISPHDMAEISARHLNLLQNGDIEFSLYESRINVDQLKSDIRSMVFDRGCKLVFVDNLNFILEPKRQSDQIMEMDRVVHDLIEFVKQIDVHIIMVMHPRKTEDARVESEFDVKGSSTAVQEAQNVLLFNPPRQADLEKEIRAPWDREIKIAKMRRRGIYVGKSIWFSNHNTCYVENTGPTRTPYAKRSQTEIAL